ncbi:hypothetical protein [Dactylosporangium sp. NPDC051541]|uniref:hypothetical protein n=1 Tax=Dactylosporangium sp. NPDC051541 TaxID=3363977 RepID=UPI00378C8F88
MARSWTWESGCCSRRDGCGGTVTVTVSSAGDRLDYRGFCGDAGYGGDYGIGSQAIGDFIANGPPVPMPPAVAAEIRAAGRR